MDVRAYAAPAANAPLAAKTATPARVRICRKGMAAAYTAWPLPPKGRACPCREGSPIVHAERKADDHAAASGRIPGRLPIPHRAGLCRLEIPLQGCVFLLGCSMALTACWNAS